MMLEVLKFVFSDFAHWLGSLIMLCVVVGGIAATFDGGIKILAFLSQGRRS